MRISKTGKGFKPLSLILSLAILFGCISAGFVFNVSAANDNFDAGCYLEEKYSDTDFGMHSNIWDAVKYKNKIDFTKGFYFRGYGKLDLATFSSEVEDGGDQRIVVLADEGKTYFIQAVPFEKDTETWYRFVASDASGEKFKAMNIDMMFSRN